MNKKIFSVIRLAAEKCIITVRVLTAAADSQQLAGRCRLDPARSLTGSHTAPTVTAPVPNLAPRVVMARDGAAQRSGWTE